jgi:hypothetical protein
MNRIALMSDERRNELFSLTAERRGMRSGAIVEKDFWVTWVLGRLFASPLLGTRSGVRRDRSPRRPLILATDPVSDGF